MMSNTLVFFSSPCFFPFFIDDPQHQGMMNKRISEWKRMAKWIMRRFFPPLYSFTYWCFTYIYLLALALSLSLSQEEEEEGKEQEREKAIKESFNCWFIFPSDHKRVFICLLWNSHATFLCLHIGFFLSFNLDLLIHISFNPMPYASSLWILVGCTRVLCKSLCILICIYICS